MKRNKTGKVVLSVLLVVLMTLSMIPLTNAALVSLPLKIQDGRTVADADTRYVAEIEQDPVTKMITASIVVRNQGTGTTTICFTVIGTMISFNSQVAPYRYNPINPPGDTHPYDAGRMYFGGLNTLESEFEKYCYRPIEECSKSGTTAIRNDTGGRYIGGKISPADEVFINVPPGGQVTMAQFYFMPVNGTDTLNIDMFNFTYANILTEETFVRTSPYILNGPCMLVIDSRQTTSMYSYFLSQPTNPCFLLHVKKPAPTNLTAGTPTDERVVGGYNVDTMEWSYSATGTFTTGMPIVLDDAHTIYVRYKADNYIGDGVSTYGNYKRALASDPVPVVFGASIYDVVPYVRKTSTGLTPHTDGKVHVGDRIQFTVVVRNDGDPKSEWLNAVMTDTMPTGVTFAGNVRINGALQTENAGYTISSPTGTLTVPLGTIAGGVAATKTVTFEVTVNNSAYGTKITNSVTVTGKQGDDDVSEETEDEDGPDIPERSEKPTIDPVTQGDSTISGTGVPGATVTLDLGDGKPLITVPVVDDGTGKGVWTADVTGREPNAGDVIKAVQKEDNKDPSEEETAIVGGRPQPVRDYTKTAENLTHTDGTRHVKDVLRYTITLKNVGPAKSLLENVEITDIIPTEVDFDLATSNIRINGDPAGLAATYTSGSRTLKVYLGNIPSGGIKEVTFEVKINATAYGKSFVNSATVRDKDDEIIVIEDPDDPPEVVDQTEPPTIDEVNEGDRVVQGTGINGAEIEVTFPDGVTKRKAIVADEKWSVDVPVGINLIEGDFLYATQKKDPDDISEPVEAEVFGKKPVDSHMTKTSTNTTGPNDITRVGDIIGYTITLENKGSPKSYWTNAVVFDTLPVGVTLNENSILVNGGSPSYSDYNPVTRTLIVTIWQPTGPLSRGIQGQTSVTVYFTVTVNPNTYGLAIKNAASVEGYANGGTENDDKVDDSCEEEGERRVRPQSRPPIVDDISKGDREITGTGEPESKIYVELPDGTKLPPVDVDENGDWTVTLPDDADDLKEGDVVKIVQEEPESDPSVPVEKIVKDKNYRAVHGYVWPMVTYDLGLSVNYPGLSEQFMRAHDIQVELRKAYWDPAAPGLSVASTLVVNPEKEGLGEFTIENVPFDDYVLVIKRAGYLVRCMNVTISATPNDTIELEPPNTNGDDGVFNLIWGDVDDSFNIDNDDLAQIILHMSLGITVFSPNYEAACDLDASGKADNDDIGLVINMWNKYVYDYAGSAGVKFNP